MKLKYVVFDTAFPVIFGEYFQHREVNGPGGKPTSAGFLTVSEIDTPEGSSFCQARILKATCYGESISLGVKSRGEQDAHLIDKMLNV